MSLLVVFLLLHVALTRSGTCGIRASQEAVSSSIHFTYSYHNEHEHHHHNHIYAHSGSVLLKSYLIFFHYIFHDQ